MFAVLRTLHSERRVITGEECSRVGAAGRWWFDELALTTAVKPPGVVQQTLDALEGYAREVWYNRAVKPIKGLLFSTCQLVCRLCECCLQHQSSLSAPVPPTFSSDCVPTHIVDLWY